MSTKKLTLVMAGLVAIPSATFISNEAINDAFAGTQNENVGVSAQVNNNCTFTNSAATVDFGEYDPVDANATVDDTATAVVEIKCTKGAVAVLTMDDGLYGSGTGAAMVRALSKDGGTTNLAYNLYREVGHTNVWSSGGSNQTSYTSTSAATKQPFTVYGMIAAGIDAATGTYTDTVVMTATY